MARTRHIRRPRIAFFKFLASARCDALLTKHRAQMLYSSMPQPSARSKRQLIVLYLLPKLAASACGIAVSAHGPRCDDKLDQGRDAIADEKSALENTIDAQHSNVIQHACRL
jgi:hypothetical protein